MDEQNPQVTEEASDASAPKKRKLFSKKPKEPIVPVYKELNFNNLTVRYDSARINKKEIDKRNLILYPGVAIATLLSVGIPMWIVAPSMERHEYSQLSITLWCVLLAVMLASFFLYMVYRLLMLKIPKYFEFVEWIMRFGKNDIKIGYHKGELVILVRINGKWSRKHFEWFPDKIMNEDGVDKNSDVFVSLDLTKNLPVFNVINV